MDKGNQSLIELGAPISFGGRHGEEINFSTTTLNW